MQIKIHDVSSFVRSITDGKFRAFGVLDKLGVIVGSKGIVLVCSEGVHWVRDTPDDTFTVELEPDAKGCFSIMPTHQTKCTVQDIMDTEFEEKPLSEFVRKMGPDHRLERNYIALLHSIEKIGLDSGLDSMAFRSMMQNKTLEDHCKKWLQDLRDIGQDENPDYPESQLTRFERNLLKDLEKLFPEKTPDTRK